MAPFDDRGGGRGLGGWWVVMVGLFVSVLVVDGTDPPDYIPKDFRPIQEGDFSEYFEYWDIASIPGVSSTFLQTTYKQPIDMSKVFNADTAGNDQMTLMPIYNENRFVYAQNEQQPMNWYDLWAANQKDSNPVCGPKHNETDPKYQFLFYHYLFVNSHQYIDINHIFDETEDPDDIIPGHPNNCPKLHDIGELPTDLMTSFVKHKVVETCKNQHCVLNMDFPGSGAIWASKEDHYVMFRQNMFLIVRHKNETVPLHYILKHQDNYFYFPEDLPTFADPEFLSKTKSGDYKSRPFMIPIMKDTDKFIERRNQFTTTTTPAPTTVTTPTTTSEVTTVPSTTTTTTKKSPPLGPGRALAKYSATPENVDYDESNFAVDSTTNPLVFVGLAAVVCLVVIDG